jgi:alanyl-tRNA synthetase
LRIVGERGIAAGVRRIEALTGLPAVVRARRDARLLAGMEDLLKSTGDAAPEALVNVLAAQKAQSRELEKLRLKVAQLEMRAGDGSASAPQAFQEVAGVRLVARRVAGLDRPALRTLADNLKREVGSGVVVLACDSGGKVSLLAAITTDLEGRLDARALIKDLAALVGGGGGGNALMAEAGGKDAEKISDVIGSAGEILERHLAASRAKG